MLLKAEDDEAEDDGATDKQDEGIVGGAEMNVAEVSNKDVTVEKDDKSEMDGEDNSRVACF